MSRAAVRGLYMLLGNTPVVTPPVTDDCLPYSRPAYNAASVNLTEALTVIANGSANINVCEVMT